ncbi:hypothetical protein [Streptacidiphilus fuscans]|uniref:Uncharacterized protein n=1 Tax=Streptacidiphilus fuscans TaxID=2789292 RepID=A0A931B2K6_9ACTN|nr:hypothetical protein [Streptacidiphilus fuscans]MBF9069118.1 hypothetical protein [Streptacidiphilus fuscans]
MNRPEDVENARREAHVTVSPVHDDGSGEPTRRVDVAAMPVGNAYSVADVAEFMRRAGLDAALIQDPGIVAWQGGGPDVWR